MYNEMSANLEFENPLERQVRDLQANPQMLKIDPASRVELLLEKQRLQKEKLRQQKEMKEQKDLQQCTFKPNIEKSQVS